MQKAYSEEVHNLYLTPIFGIGSACTPNGKSKDDFNILKGKPIGRRPHGRPGPY